MQDWPAQRPGAAVTRSLLSCGHDAGQASRWKVEEGFLKADPSPTDHHPRGRPSDHSPGPGPLQGRLGPEPPHDRPQVSPTFSPFPRVLLTFSLLLEGQEQPWVQDILLWLPAVVSAKAKSKESRHTRPWQATSGNSWKGPAPLALQSPLMARASRCRGRVPPNPTHA